MRNLLYLLDHLYYILITSIKKRGIEMNILWDFDGTLFNTYPALVEGFVQLSRQNLDPSEVLIWLKKDSKTAFKHYGISEDRREEYRELYNHYAKISSKPYPHLEEALSSADHNIIVTHREKDSTLLLLEKFDLKKYFTEIVSVEEEGFKRKPDISSYEYVRNRFNIDLVVGDRDLDLIPAKKLNIKTAAFQNRNIQADYYFDCYSDFQSAVLWHFSANE
jgi:HAD superfamily hydrolase (TIGR01549 family)